MTPSDLPATFAERIRDAAATKTALRISAGGSKSFYGETIDGEMLDVSGYAGIIDYEPKELVLTVRAGTPLAEVESVLARAGQMLPFEPPHYGPRATIGGVVATGLSGPRRPYVGAVRDFVLGARIINGRGEDLRFGGRVIKNVAGYDVSRLMVGALGTLGVLLDLSFKVLPRPATEVTRMYALDEAAARQQINAWSGRPLPISASSWHEGVLRVRLSGAESAVRRASETLGGDVDSAGAAWWQSLREHTAPFFQGEEATWRVSVPQTAPSLTVDAPRLVEWGGGVVWLRGSLAADVLRAQTRERGGHATLFRGGDRLAGVFQPLEPALFKIHRRLKEAFDPAGILNPGKMYRGL
jgi:glycolate oxidase FAD binding subunit